MEPLAKLNLNPFLPLPDSQTRQSSVVGKIFRILRSNTHFDLFGWPEYDRRSEFGNRLSTNSVPKSLLFVLQIISVFLLMPVFTLAFGPPEYLPDGPHPRIAVTAPVIAKLRIIDADGTDVWWLRMKNEATADIPDAANWPTSEKIPDAYALLWLVTGETQYRDAGLASLGAGLNYYDAIPVGNTSGFRASVSDPYRWISERLFRAYDWLYNEMTAQQRQDWANMLCNFATYQKNNGYKSTDAGNNYFGAQFRGALMAGIITCGLTVSNPPGDISGVTDQPLDLLNWGRTTKYDYIKEVMTPGYGSIPRTGIYAGGVYPEGPEYSPQTLGYIYSGMDALKDSTGQDLFADITDWLTAHVYFTLHQSAPDNGYSYPRNDYLNNSVAKDPIKPSNAQAVMMLILEKNKANTTEGSYLQYWLKTYGIDYLTSNWWAPSKGEPTYFIYFDENYSESDYRSVPIPLTFYGGNNFGHVLSRYGWADDSIWWGYEMGWRGTDHMHASSGHFSIKRKGEWVIGHEVGWAGNWLYTKAHNCMLLQNKWPQNRWTSQLVTPFGWHEGGQYYTPNPGPYGSDTIGDDLRDLPDLVYEEVQEYIYISGEDTGHYNNPTYLSEYLDHHFRSFVDLRDGIFVVFDKVKNNEPDLFKKFIIHMPKPDTPDINGNYIENSTTYSDVRVTAVFPVDAALSFIDETTDNAGYVNYFRVTSQGDAASLTEKFLNVIDIRDKGAAAKTITKIETAGMAGVHIRGVTDKIVLFGTDYNGGCVTGNITYSVPFLTNPEHILFNLSPGSKFSLSSSASGGGVAYVLTQNADGNLTVSANGVLHIQGIDNSKPEPPAGLTIE